MKRIIAASQNILGPYAKWYKVATPQDLLDYGVDETDVNFVSELEEYDLEQIGTAVIDERKLFDEEIDALSDEGYEMLSIGRSYDTGEVGLYIILGDGVNSVTVEDIEFILE